MLFDPKLYGDWRARLDMVVQTLREMSQQTEPEALVHLYQRTFERGAQWDHLTALSRRGLEPPCYYVTRSSRWQRAINPWEERDQLPILQGGFLGELLAAGEPCVLDDYTPEPDDPGYDQLEGMRSFMALPMYDHGEAMTLVLLMSAKPGHFDRERLADFVWVSGLFSIATANLVLSREITHVNQMLDRELQVVADMQRALLPVELPEIRTLRVSVHYSTARRAGGDYYDLFKLPDDKWGIFIADVSGKGTPAAVMMAIAHAIGYSFPGPPVPPSAMLRFINERLSSRYACNSGAFVTAFYGIFDVAARRLTYASAGHNPPRLATRGECFITALDGTQGVPLGIYPSERYNDQVVNLAPGDRVVLYTDGISEAMNAEGQMFDLERLDMAILEGPGDAGKLVESIMHAVEKFTDGCAPNDDRTLLALEVI